MTDPHYFDCLLSDMQGHFDHCKVVESQVMKNFVKSLKFKKPARQSSNFDK